MLSTLACFFCSGVIAAVIGVTPVVVPAVPVVPKLAPVFIASSASSSFIKSDSAPDIILAEGMPVVVAVEVTGLATSRISILSCESTIDGTAGATPEPSGAYSVPAAGS